jgi:ATP synthase protein I
MREGDRRQELQRELQARSARKRQARAEGDRSALTGLALFGMVGWAVVVPMLLGLALGLWIDRHLPSRFSWTLMLLVLGTALGCLNAWHWIRREQNR